MADDFTAMSHESHGLCFCSTEGHCAGGRDCEGECRLVPAGSIPARVAAPAREPSTAELVNAAVLAITPNFVNETQAWNVWNDLNGTPEFVAAFLRLHSASEPQPEQADPDAVLDPHSPHRYRGNASGLTCWVGQNHDAGICGKRGEDRIHDPSGEAWGFTAGGWQFLFVAPEGLRCPELESGGEQCIHLASTSHLHEVDARLLGGEGKVVARRRAAGPVEAVTA